MPLGGAKATRLPRPAQPCTPARAGATIGYLPQEPQLPDGATVLQAVLQSDSAVTKAVQAYQRALHASAERGGAANKVGAYACARCLGRRAV